jgi:hypothetical protein
MDEQEPVTVFLALNYTADEPMGDDDEVPEWLTWLSGPACLLQEDPTFADAADAVRVWRAQGVERIIVSLGSWSKGEQLWAGLGAAPTDPKTGEQMRIFSDDDPRGRPEGARATRLADAEAFNKELRAWYADMPRRDGDAFRLRRESLGLSIDAVSERTGLDPRWLADVEAGLAGPLKVSQWVELVWATREPWPDPRRSLLSGIDQMWGWFPGPGGFITASALVERVVKKNVR